MQVVFSGSVLRCPNTAGAMSIFYLPDGVRPWDGQHVIRVLEFFASAFGRQATELDEVTRSVGLEQVLGKHVCALSKGYARRLMLALALLTPHPVAAYG